MTMTPTEFEERYAEALTGQPTSTDVTGDLDRGRRLLRRRRMTGATSALVIALMVGGTAFALAGGRSTRTQPPPPAVGKPIEARTLLQECRNGNAGQKGVAALFGSGTPLVRSVARVAGHTDAALSSRDGRYWAACSVRSDPQAEFHASMTVYANRGHQDVVESTLGKGYYSTIDHRPAAVAAVRFLMTDGVTRTVPTDHGYFAFSYLGTAPGQDLSTKRITFLDATGKPIAAEVQDGTGSGPDGENVAGLPRLGRYPSLRPPYAVGEKPPAPPSLGPGSTVIPAT